VKSSPQRLWAVATAAIVLAVLIGAEARAAAASCQSRSDGKLDCMEFVGSLPTMLKAVCTLAGGSQWVENACPKNDVLGFCDIRRNDGIRQRLYCYPMAGIPLARTLEYCRMGCKGSFSTEPGMPATPEVALKPLGDSVMEVNTNRFGEDYRDLDLTVPDPALCAQACKEDVKCRAWTYVKPGVQADDARCWLKDKVPPPSPDDNCVSGVRGQRR